MTPRLWAMLAGSAFFLALAVGLSRWLDQRHFVSEAMSPDGSWSVSVSGRRRLSGAYELTAEVRDASGTPRPGGVVIIGLASTWADAITDHKATFVNATQVQIGPRTLDKSTYFDHSE